MQTSQPDNQSNTNNNPSMNNPQQKKLNLKEKIAIFKTKNKSLFSILVATISFLGLTLVAVAAFYIIEVLPQQRALNAPESEPAAYYYSMDLTETGGGLPDPLKANTLYTLNINLKKDELVKKCSEITIKDEHNNVKPNCKLIISEYNTNLATLTIEEDALKIQTKADANGQLTFSVTAERIDDEAPLAKTEETFYIGDDIEYTILFDKKHDGVTSDGVDDVGASNTISFSTYLQSFDLDPILIKHQGGQSTQIGSEEDTTDDVTFEYKILTAHDPTPTPILGGGAATVNIDGIIQARKTGLVKVRTIPYLDGEQKKPRDVTVAVALSDEPDPGSRYSLTADVSNLDLEAGDTETIALSFTEDGQPVDAPDDVTYSWVSSDTNVATVTNNGNESIITAVADGNATITATATVDGVDYTTTITIAVGGDADDPTDPSEPSDPSPGEQTGDVSLDLTVALDGAPYSEKQTSGTRYFDLVKDPKSIDLQLTLQGTNQDAENHVLTLPYDETNHVFSIENYTLSNVNSGPYALVLKGPQHLGMRFCYTGAKTTQRCTTDDLLGASRNYTTKALAEANNFIWLEANSSIDLDFSDRPLLAGDLPLDVVNGKNVQDNSVDVRDYSLIMTCMNITTNSNTTVDNATCLKLADLNYSGKVDTTDLQLLKKTLSQKFDQL